MMKRKAVRAAIVLLLGSAVWVSPLPSQAAEAAAKSATKGGSDAGSAERSGIRIRKFSSMGNQSNIKMPEIKANIPASPKPPQDWVQVFTVFDTAPECIEELTFQYYVLAEKVVDGKKAYSLYKCNVRYGDIEGRKGHLSGVFMPPVAAKRFGPIVAAAVEISRDGTIVAEEDESSPAAKLPKKWWTQIDTFKDVTVRDGYLLPKNKSPFYFVNVDDYEMER